MTMHMDGLGFIEDDNLPESFRENHAAFLQDARRALDRLYDKRQKIDRDARLTDEGRQAAKRETSEKILRELVKSPGLVKTRQLQKSVEYRTEVLVKSIWPPARTGAMNEASRIAVDREIRDYLRTLSDDGATTLSSGERRTDRTAALHAAAVSGDGDLMLAVLNSPRALGLFKDEDIAHARETYIEGRIAELDEAQTAPLTEARSAAAAFEQVVSTIERHASAKFDAEPRASIKMVG